MKTGKIQISDKHKITKTLNRNNSLFIIIVIICILIDYDLFSIKPKYLVTEGYFWKALAIVFQLAFIASLIQWETKKRKITNILNNGIITQGQLKMSERIKPNKRASFYLHLFQYTVDNKIYEVTLKNKRNSIASNFIIYQLTNPKNGVVFEGLKTDLKTLIKEHNYNC